MIEARDVSGLVLAGGQGRRLQQSGRPYAEKGLAQLHDRPLVSWAVSAMPTGLHSVYVSANRHLDDYAAYGVVVRDDPALGDDLGPLGGVASAMRIMPTQWLYTAPADVPRPPSTVFPSLLERANALRCDLVFAQTDRPQPLFMLVNKNLLPSLESYLQAGSRQVQVWQRGHGAAVYFDVADNAFFNVNTYADLRVAHQLITPSPS